VDPNDFSDPDPTFQLILDPDSNSDPAQIFSNILNFNFTFGCPSCKYFRLYIMTRYTGKLFREIFFTKR